MRSSIMTAISRPNVEPTSAREVEELYYRSVYYSPCGVSEISHERETKPPRESESHFSSWWKIAPQCCYTAIYFRTTYRNFMESKNV